VTGSSTPRRAGTAADLPFGHREFGHRYFQLLPVMDAMVQSIDLRTLVKAVITD